uniref:Uncharacterized protein n=1 Tax=Micrurus corallinus TaxID=54390 RepID=A0A2D4EJQ4_MICCO
MLSFHALESEKLKIFNQYNIHTHLKPKNPLRQKLVHPKNKIPRHKLSTVIHSHYRRTNPSGQDTAVHLHLKEKGHSFEDSKTHIERTSSLKERSKMPVTLRLNSL